MSQSFAHIGRALAAYRDRSRLSQTAFATKAGVSKATVNKIEANEIVPTLPVSLKIANAMEMDLAQLIDPRNRPKIYYRRDPKDSKKKASKDGSFICLLMSEESPNTNINLYHFEFSKKGSHLSTGHGNRSTEYIVMEKGEMTMEINGEEINLKAGETLEFDASFPHRYVQKTSKLTKGVQFVYFW